MSSSSNDVVLRHLRFLVAAWKEDPHGDAELLRRFAADGDEAAFTTLVGRHAPMVWGVCLRLLQNTQDAEDAFQATFLQFARDAGLIARRESLGGWLYSTARCRALDARRANRRRRRLETQLQQLAERSPNAPKASTPDGLDLKEVLDEELQKLPSKFRDVMLLCQIEGRTYADAATELGCSTAAVHRRLIHAQDLLRRRLTRRGVIAGVVAALVASVRSANAVPPARLMVGAVEGGMGVLRTGVLPPTAAGLLAGGGVGAGKAKALAAAVGVAVLVAGGLMVAVHLGGTESAPPTALLSADSPKSPAPLTVSFGGSVRGDDGRPLRGGRVSVLARQPYEPGAQGLRDRSLASLPTDESGGFRLEVPTEFATWFPERRVTLLVSAPGHAPLTRSVPLEKVIAGDGLDLRLAAGKDLTGQLLDPDGRPAAGVRLRVVRLGHAAAEPVHNAAPGAPPGWPDDVVTDPDGGFELPGLATVENVWAMADDPRFARQTFPLKKGESPQVCRLSPPRTVRLEVRAADTDEPLAARVTLVTDQVASHAHLCTVAGDRENVAAGPPVEIDALADSAGRLCLAVPYADEVEIKVTPPGDRPYLGGRKVLKRGDDGVVVVRLPRGVWLHGRAVAGATVLWARQDPPVPEWRDEILLGRDALVRAAADGSFRVAVPPGPCVLRFHGPSLDFLARRHSLEPASTRSVYAHDLIALTAPDQGPLPWVDARFRHGEALTGTVTDGGTPAGDETIILASGRVSPVRPYGFLPLPVRRGRFTLPGHDPGNAELVYALDPRSRRGAVAEAVPGAALKLEACGSATLRGVDASGKPVAGCEVSVALMVDRPRARAGDGADELNDDGADAQPVWWFDPVNYPDKPRTDADGRVTLPALIPGARYRVSATVPGRKAEFIREVRVRPGEEVSLGDVVIPVP